MSESAEIADDGEPEELLYVVYDPESLDPTWYAAERGVDYISSARRAKVAGEEHRELIAQVTTDPLSVRVVQRSDGTAVVRTDVTARDTERVNALWRYLAALAPVRAGCEPEDEGAGG